jgi:CBS domain-containing protein
LAREIMKHNPIKVTREADSTEGVKIMSHNMISGLPVVNSVNSLVGILTSTYITVARGGDLKRRYMDTIYHNYILQNNLLQASMWYLRLATQP